MSTRIYVGRLSPRVRDGDVERLFRSYGRIRDIMLKTGYGFVEFEDTRDAEDASYECNGKEFMGDKLIVELAKGTPHGRDRLNWLPVNQSYSSSASRYNERRSRNDARSEYRVIVDNLSSRATWQDLKDFVRQADCEVVHTDTDSRRNEGYVEFATRRDMTRAIDMLDGKELNGRKVRLFEDKPRRRYRSRSCSRDRRSRSRSKGRRTSKLKRSGSRSRSHSRDRSSARKRRDDRSGSRDRKEGSRDRADSRGKRSPKSGEKRVSRKRSASGSPTPRKRRRSDSKDGRRSGSGNRSKTPDLKYKKESRKSRSASRSRSRSSEKRPAARGAADEDDKDISPKWEDADGSSVENGNN